MREEDRRSTDVQWLMAKQAEQMRQGKKLATMRRLSHARYFTKQYRETLEDRIAPKEPPPPVKRRMAFLKDKSKQAAKSAARMSVFAPKQSEDAARNMGRASTTSCCRPLRLDSVEGGRSSVPDRHKCTQASLPSVFWCPETLLALPSMHFGCQENAVN